MKSSRRQSPLFLFVAWVLIATSARAEDWPQFRGPHRDAIWNETNVLQIFPAGGLKVRWRAPVGYGLSSPVVVDGRVYLIDAELQKPKVHERIHCFDEKTGQALWTYAHEVHYPEWAFDPSQKAGPNSTLTVQDGKLLAVGATGQLLCLDAFKGEVLWRKDLTTDYNMAEFSGTTPSPLIEGDCLILLIGGKPNASVVALDKNSGKEVWRALEDKWTYSSPIVIHAGGQPQLIIWTPDAVTSLNPTTGKTWWREELTAAGNLASVATPVVQGDLLLLSGLMFQLDATKPAATVLWPQQKSGTKRILSQTSIPLILGEYVYSGKAPGKLVCLEARTGIQIWETDKVTPKSSGSAIQLTLNGDSVLIYTDEGNLIRARLSPQGYEELSRVHVIDPTYAFSGKMVVWPPPAYANRHIFVRNDQELISASLEAAP